MYQGRTLSYIFHEKRVDLSSILVKRACGGKTGGMTYDQFDQANE